MFNSYLKVELPRESIYHAGHHNVMAKFKSAVYVHNRCRSKYNETACTFSNLSIGLWSLMATAIS